MYIEEMSVKAGVEKKTFNFNEAVASAKEYFGGDELAATVWVNKYALKDSYGKIYEQTPAEMHRRLAREIARVEKRYVNPLSEYLSACKSQVDDPLLLA